MVEREQDPRQRPAGGRPIGFGPPWAANLTWGPQPPLRRPGALAPASTAHLRISTDERAAVCDALTTHHLAGRLDIDEFSERLEVAYAAKTRGDLEPLLADLPVVPVERPAPTRPRRRVGLNDLWLVALVAVAAVMVIGMVTGRPLIPGGWWLVAAIGIWWGTGTPARPRRATATRGPAART